MTAATPTLCGPHHLTGVTADVRANLDFWCGVLGLRFVKNTLNFESTYRYHSYFGDEEGSPGSIVTFLEFNEAPKGRPGRGNIQRIVLRVGSYASIEFWMDRLVQAKTHWDVQRLNPALPDSLIFEDPEGHGVELMVSDATDEPLVADADDIPLEHRIRGIEGVRSFLEIEEQLPFAEHVGFRRDRDRLVLDGSARSGRWYFSEPPERAGTGGRPTVGVWHHLAYDAGDHDETQAFRDYGDTGPLPFTRLVDHYYFDSCAAFSPAGLFEVCTTGPGFLIDQELDELGDVFSLPERLEPLRERLERELTPLPNPRPRRKTADV